MSHLVLHVVCCWTDQLQQSVVAQAVLECYLSFMHQICIESVLLGIPMAQLNTLPFTVRQLVKCMLGLHECSYLTAIAKRSA